MPRARKVQTHTQGEEVPTRNLFLRAPEPLKDKLKQLAESSRLSLHIFCLLVLEEAAKNEVKFKIERAEM